MSFKRRILVKHKIFENNERGDPLMLGHVVRSIIEIHNENVLNLNFPGNSNLETWNHGNLATVKGGTLPFCINFPLKSLQFIEKIKQTCFFWKLQFENVRSHPAAQNHSFFNWKSSVLTRMHIFKWYFCFFCLTIQEC